MENTESPTSTPATEAPTATSAPASAPAPAAAATTKPSRNPFKKVLTYLQGEADKSAKNRWEGSSYLSSSGMEPQQRYRKKSKPKDSTRSTSEVSAGNTQIA